MKNVLYESEIKLDEFKDTYLELDFSNEFKELKKQDGIKYVLTITQFIEDED